MKTAVKHAGFVELFKKGEEKQKEYWLLEEIFVNCYKVFCIKNLVLQSLHIKSFEAHNNKNSVTGWESLLL